MVYSHVVKNVSVAAIRERGRVEHNAGMEALGGGGKKDQVAVQFVPYCPKELGIGFENRVVFRFSLTSAATLQKGEKEPW